MKRTDRSFIKTSPLENFCYWLNIFLLSVLVLSILFPLLNIFALSFNDGKDAARGGVYLWPRVWSLGNYKEVLKDDSIIQGYKITIARTVIGTSASLFLMAMAAFVLRSPTLPGKTFFSVFLLITMLFSGGTIPYYILLKSLHLLDNFWVYVLPSLYSAWYIIIMRTFFQGISPSLEESAKLDGCNDFQIFMKVYLPLSKPVLSVIGLFVGVGHWNDWFAGSYYVMAKELRPVQTIMYEMLTSAQRIQELMQSQGGAVHTVDRAVTGESIKMATIVISTLPIVLVYPFIQKYFATGLMVGAVKE